MLLPDSHDPTPALPLHAVGSPFACGWSASDHDAAWVHVSGDLDLAVSERLARTLREAQQHARLVVVDLRDVGFMDSAGVHVILDAAARARSAAAGLVVVRGAEQGDVFALTGTSHLVEMFELEPVAPTVQVLLRRAAAARFSPPGSTGEPDEDDLQRFG